MKICKRCGIEKEDSDFSADRSQKDGMQRVCNPCLRDAHNSRVQRRIAERLIDGIVVIPETKICKSCGIEKQSKEFPKDRATIDGIGIYCKACHIVRGKQFAKRTGLINDTNNLNPYEIDRLKRCPKCDTEKSVQEFSRKKTNKEGLSAWCKSCCSISTKSITDKHRENNINSINDDIDNSVMKICGTCKTEKSIAMFSKNIASKDGFHNRCKECESESNKKKYWENPEESRRRVREYQQAHPEMWQNWYAANIDEIRIKDKAYREANPEKRKALITEWRKNNPEKNRSYDQNRRARKNESVGTLSPDLYPKLFKLQRGCCAICKEKLSHLRKNNHLDHVFPLVPRKGDKAGDNTNENMQLLCYSCNSKKGNKDPIKYMQSLGFLL